MTVPLVGSIVSFVVALLGALGRALTSRTPLVGSIVALGVWVGVVEWRYPGGCVKAGIIGLGAWVAALLVLFVVNAVFGAGAFGVPGA